MKVLFYDGRESWIYEADSIKEITDHVVTNRTTGYCLHEITEEQFEKHFKDNYDFILDIKDSPHKAQMKKEVREAKKRGIGHYMGELPEEHFQSFLR